MPMRIELQDVTVGYGDVKILENVNLTLDGPGLTCIIGPNGVGKSTLIKCFNRLNEPMSGKVLLNGRDVSEMHRKEIAEIVSYVPVQSDDMFAMPVFDSVMIGRSNKNQWKSSREDVVRVHKVLEVLGISHLADRPSNQLSAGQHQTVSIARGLVQETEILMLDEPTANLDVRRQIFITSLMHEIAVSKGIMVIMVSHNLNIASMFADNVILMAKPGVIKQVGPASDVITKENISEVYEVGCEIVEHQGRPVMLLDQNLY